MILSPGSLQERKLEVGGGKFQQCLGTHLIHYSLVIQPLLFMSWCFVFLPLVMSSSALYCLCSCACGLVPPLVLLLSDPAIAKSSCCPSFLSVLSVSSYLHRLRTYRITENLCRNRTEVYRLPSSCSCQIVVLSCCSSSCYLLNFCLLLYYSYHCLIISAYALILLLACCYLLS